MNFHAVQHLHESRVTMIHNLTVTKIQFGNLCHIFSAKFKIPDIQILLHTLFMNRFWNDSYTPLYIPAQSHLCSALSIFFTNLCQHRMGKDAGKLAVEYARKVLDQTGDMVNSIRDYDRKRRTIFVGSCAPAPLWNLIPALSDLYPDMTISSEIRDSEVLLQGLQDGTYQTILLPFSVEEKGIFCVKYKEEHLLFSLPPAHPLSGSSGLYLKDLNGESMLLRPQLGFWEHIINEKMPNTHFIVQKDTDFDELVKASALPTFNSDLVIQREGKVPNRITIPILDEEVNVTYYCCYT